MLDRATYAQNSVIGALLIDARCAPLVTSKLTPDDFIDPICRNFFVAIRDLVLEGRPVDPVTVLARLKSGDDYVQWARECMEITPTAANVEAYIPEVLKAARRRKILDLSEKLAEADDDEMEAIVRKMSLALSATERMPMMTARERVNDFFSRMRSPEKPKYLPWGVPVADRWVCAELGDMILLGGFASSGKTLLSIIMAQAQAKAGYKVGYYSLETSPQKMTDRQLSGLAQVPLAKIKRKDFAASEWERFAEAGSFAATEGGFDIIDASGSTAEDIAAHAIGYGYQVIYVDYVQNLIVPGMRSTDDYARVTAISQTLKTFARNTKTAVIALAQLTRPGEERTKGKPDEGPLMPTMHSFKGSGQLEQDADVAFLVFPANRRDNDSNRKFLIAKNKEGWRPPAVELAFHGDTQTMVELEPRPDHSVAAEFAARGDAIKQRNRANSQTQFRELHGGGIDNPFADE